MQDIVSVINTLANNLYSTVEEEVFTALDKLLVITKEILEIEPLKNMNITSENNSIVLLALCFATMAGICFALKKMVNMYRADKGLDVMQFMLRLVICSMLSVSAWYICETVLDINGIVTEIIQSIGKDVTGENISFDTLKEVISNIDTDESFLSLDGAIKGMVGFGAVTLLFTFCIRYFMTVFLIVVSPLAFMTAIDKSTLGIFLKWVKSYLSNVLLQNVALIFMIIPLTIKDTDSLVFKVVLVGSIYSLYKVKDFVMGFVSNISFEREG